MYVVITMAGLGSRFREAGYDRPKFAIEAHGRSLFSWSVGSLSRFAPVARRFIFVTLAGDDAAPFIREESRQLGIPDSAVVELPALTSGQASTVLRAGEWIDDASRPLLVYNIDTHIDPVHLRPENVRGDGWIPCFPGAGDSWSFARVDPRGRVVEVREKRRISDHASVGLYHFGSFDLYREIYERHFAVEHPDDPPERYIAPMYNTLIDAGGDVRLHELPLDAVHPLGTPEQLRRFANEDRPVGIRV